MRRALPVACLLAALAFAGCGDGGTAIPKGNPDTRHGPQAVDSYAQVEFLRALLIASSDSYYAGGSADDARAQLNRAKTGYDSLAGRVRAADPVVDREVSARFAAASKAIREGTAPDHYRDLVGPLADQLMDGVSQALVPASARTDAGVQAVALSRVALRMSATYDASTASAGDTPGRLAFEEAWGLWRRAQALDVLLATELGSKKSRVASALNNLRGPAFPNGPIAPDAPAAPKVDAASTKVIQTLNDRFRLAL